MNCTPVFEVTEESDGTSVDRTEFRANGVDVQESLMKKRITSYSD
jgi:hypothetical protein